MDSGKTTNNTAMIRDIYTKKKESPLEVQRLAVWLEGGPMIIVRSFNGVCVCDVVVARWGSILVIRCYIVRVRVNPNPS